MAAIETDTKLNGWDIGVVISYFIIVIGVGIFASFRASKGTVAGYFLAGRRMMFITVGASLFVSNIGSEHFIGLAGSGAAGGIAVGAWEFNALILLQLLGFVCVPVYIACQTYTMPQYLSKRFGGTRLRVYFAVLSLILYIFTKCSVGIYTGALFIQQSLGWDLYRCIVVLLTIVAILTITGGLTAVMYTDTFQAFLMLGGGIVLTIIGFRDVGGFHGLWTKYPYAITTVTVPNTTCHIPNSKWDVMLKEPDDPDMPWPGFLLGQTPSSVWYWCADQVIVQRSLAAKSLSHAQGATILAGFMKIAPLFIMVMPGMMSRVKYPDIVGCVDPDACYKYCQSKSGCSNIAYPKLVLGIMPSGLRGLMMAVIIAALMSDLDSIFNSASTLFTIDIWKRARKNCSIREQMIVGRVFILVMVGVSLAWVPVVTETQGGQVFIYIQEVTNYLAPQVACVFMLGILWERCNEEGAFWGLMAGFVAGAVRLILIFIYPAPNQCGAEDNRMEFLKIQYMYYSLFLCFVTTIITVIVSLCTAPLSEEYLWRTTFWTRHDKRTLEQVKAGYDRPMVTVAVQTVKTLNEGEANRAYEPEDTIVLAGTKTSAIQCDLIGGEGNAEIFTISNGPERIAPVRKDESCEDKVYRFIFGVSFHSDNTETSEIQSKLEEEKERKNVLNSLEQNKCVRNFLYFMLCVILSIGIFMYCFWSLWKYEP